MENAVTCFLWQCGCTIINCYYRNSPFVLLLGIIFDLFINLENHHWFDTSSFALPSLLIPCPNKAWPNKMHPEFLSKPDTTVTSILAMELSDGLHFSCTFLGSPSTVKSHWSKILVNTPALLIKVKCLKDTLSNFWPSSR